MTVKSGIKLENTNCLPDTEIPLINHMDNIIREASTIDCNDDDDDHNWETIFIESDRTHRDFDLPTIRLVPLFGLLLIKTFFYSIILFSSYYAGYILRKINCVSCREIFIKKEETSNQKTESLIVEKGRKIHRECCIVNPSDKFFEIVILWVKIFESLFCVTPHIPNISKTIIGKIMFAIRNNEDLSWYLNEKLSCAKHNMSILRNFIIVS
jgi:hypothetical protein